MFLNILLDLPLLSQSILQLQGITLNNLQREIKNTNTSFSFIQGISAFSSRSRSPVSRRPHSTLPPNVPEYSLPPRWLCKTDLQLCLTIFTYQVSWHAAWHASPSVPPSLSQAHSPLLRFLCLLLLLLLLLLLIQHPPYPSPSPHTLLLHWGLLLFRLIHSTSDSILVFSSFILPGAISVVIFSSREQRDISLSSLLLLHLHHHRLAHLPAHMHHVRQTLYKSHAGREAAYQACRGDLLFLVSFQLKVSIDCYAAFL